MNPLEPRPSLVNAEGFRGFIILVPEPSTIAVCLLGAATILWLRRLNR
jgi:hypothetical protein